MNDNKEIIIRLQKGDETAVEELISSNKRFVESIAKRYKDKGIFESELIEAGTEGLVTAARKYDPSHHYKFIAWAVWYIRKSIEKTIEDKATNLNSQI